MRSPPGSHMLCGQEAQQFMQAEDEVRAASEKFYAALNRMLNGDPGSLTDIWSHDASVTAMHPIGGREIGWDQVRKSFEHVSQLTSAGLVRLNDQIIQVAGDVAYELGVERARSTLAGQPVAGDCRVTNIYRRESGSWKVVHHHTDATPAMLDVASRLKK
jgi:ketosteroid isomerase-like protein